MTKKILQFITLAIVIATYIVLSLSRIDELETENTKLRQQLTTIQYTHRWERVLEQILPPMAQNELDALEETLKESSLTPMMQ